MLDVLPADRFVFSNATVQAACSTDFKIANHLNN